MATRSGIGLEKDDGTVVGVYCHWDGYPEGVGKILQEHYREPVKVETLVALGSVSSLDQEIGEKHPFNDRREGWTTFFGRDRGERGIEPRLFPSREEFRAALRSSGVEFLYLGSTGESDREIRWEVSKPFGRWRNLVDVLARGAALLVEQDPDRGPDVVYETDEGVYLFSGVTAKGQNWVGRFLWDEEEGTPDHVSCVYNEEAKDVFDRAARDGIVVDFYLHQRKKPKPPQSPDLIIERCEFEGLPSALVVLARTKAGADWMDRNRHPDVPKADPVRSVCHPDTLPMLLGARREGLVVVVEGEGL